MQDGPGGAKAECCNSQGTDFQPRWNNV